MTSFLLCEVNQYENKVIMQIKKNEGNFNKICYFLFEPLDKAINKQHIFKCSFTRE